MLPEQLRQFCLIAKSWGCEAALNYKDFVEHPSYIDSTPREYITQAQYKHYHEFKRAQRRKRMLYSQKQGYDDFGNIRPDYSKAKS